ncbi:MAG: DUF1579 family protein [Phycisphaerales bacterium JB037]
MTDQQSDQTDCGPMPAPGPEHKLLEPFAGTFRAEVKMWMGPGEPQTMTGTMLNELDLGGLVLRQTYKGDGAEGPFPNFEGRGWWAYNRAAGHYEGMWIDNAAPFFQAETGRVDPSGRVWEMTGTMLNPQTGEPLTKRTIITLQDENHHSMQTYFGTPQGEFKGMEIHYTRA